MTVRELIKSVAPLARHLKVSSGAVYKWIRVDRIPAHHLIKIAKYYGLDVLSLQPLTGSELNNKVTVVKKPRSVLKAALDVYVGVITVDKAVESTGATHKSIESILRYWKDELPTLYTTLVGKMRDEPMQLDTTDLAILDQLQANARVSNADIVRRLDGIPLAIELAAARITVLSVVQLRDRLVHRLALLVRPGDAGRHASMRRAIADTWEQLGAAEQRCLAGCTIFAGSFTLEAAEAALAGDVGPVLPLLESLALHSLVRATPRLDLDGELGLSLYETIREFAAERLAAEPALAARYRSPA